MLKPNAGLTAFRIMLCEAADAPLIRFDCQADDIGHAIEQAQDA